VQLISKITVVRRTVKTKGQPATVIVIINDTSQDDVAMHLMCGAIFNCYKITVISVLKEFCKWTACDI